MSQTTGRKFRLTVKSALEEELEESSVTNLRQGLLPTIERIQKNPGLRILIRKHGKLRAVLMSAQTYDTFKELVNFMVQRTDAMSREEQTEAAFHRLESERPPANEKATAAGPESSHSAAVPNPRKRAEAKMLVGEIAEKLRQLDTALEAKIEN